MESPEDYLTRVHALIRDRYSGDCVARAREVASLLQNSGREATLLRFRRRTTIDGQLTVWPLTPLMYLGRSGPTWNTHYVCCSNDLVYDPIIGAPVPLAGYAMQVFGQEIDSEVVPLQGAASTSSALLQRIIAFIRTLGIEVTEGTMFRTTLVPGIDLQRGGLLVEEARLCKPADLLHEAAHIALKRPMERAALDGTINGTPAEEMSAIGWVWAAATHLEIDPAEVFHEDVISGNGPWLLETFRGGSWIGVPMLQRWGMTKETSDDESEKYPRMIRWTRPA